MADSHFINQWRLSENQIICNRSMNFFVSMMSPKIDAAARRIYGLIIFTILFNIFQIAMLWILDRPIMPVLITSFFSAFIAAFSIYIINWAYRYVLSEMQSAIDASLIGEKLDKDLASWVKTVTKPSYQILTSIIFALVVIGSLCIVNEIIVLAFDLLDLILLGTLVLLWGGQGIYWAIAMPTMTKRIVQADISELNVYIASPASTPIFVSISKIFTSLGAWVGAMATITLIALFTLRPQMDLLRVLFPVSLLIGVYITATWTFLYPQHNTSVAIQRAKRNILLEFEKQMQAILKETSKLTQPKFAHFKQLFELHNIVEASPNSTFGLQKNKTFFSFFSPGLITVLGVIDWSRVFSFFFPPKP